MRRDGKERRGGGKEEIKLFGKGKRKEVGKGKANEAGWESEECEGGKSSVVIFPIRTNGSCGMV